MRGRVVCEEDLESVSGRCRRRSSGRLGGCRGGAAPQRGRSPAGGDVILLDEVGPLRASRRARRRDRLVSESRLPRPRHPRRQELFVVGAEAAPDGARFRLAAPWPRGGDGPVRPSSAGHRGAGGIRNSPPPRFFKCPDLVAATCARTRALIDLRPPQPPRRALSGCANAGKRRRGRAALLPREQALDEEAVAGDETSVVDERGRGAAQAVSADEIGRPRNAPPARARPPATKTRQVWVGGLEPTWAISTSRLAGALEGCSLPPAFALNRRASTSGAVTNETPALRWAGLRRGRGAACSFRRTGVRSPGAAPGRGPKSRVARLVLTNGAAAGRACRGRPSPGTLAAGIANAPAPPNSAEEMVGALIVISGSG